MSNCAAIAACLLLAGCAALGRQDASVEADIAAFGDCQQFDVSAGLASSNLSITSWNMHKGGTAGWAGELEHRDHANAVFIMQEALHGEPLFAALGVNQEWHFAPGYLTSAGQSGVLTATAVSAVERCRLTHREPWLRSPKASLLTRYRMRDRDETLLVANVHAINFTFGTRAYQRQLSDIVRRIRQHEGPVIFAGDFNTWSKRRQRIVNEALASLGLQAIPYDGSLVRQAFGNPLDHVFYRDLALVEASAIATDRSDHSLLTARFDYLK